MGDGSHPGEVGREGHGRGGHGRREPHGQGHPPGEEPHGGMVDDGEVVVLPAGARQGGAQFSVAQGAAEGSRTADHPQGHEGKRGMEGRDLKSEAGEDPRPHHVGDDDASGRESRYPVVVLGGGAIHVSAALLAPVPLEVRRRFYGGAPGVSSETPLPP